ncbi:hypothetical protein SPH9361_01322 [Sphingobium sp. CECT 9361]|nr:hypothetical protein SPH9361_01322 [Sphingobium sp. CECT 9361]
MRRDLNGRFRERVGIEQTTDYGHLRRDNF